MYYKHKQTCCRGSSVTGEMSWTFRAALKQNVSNSCILHPSVLPDCFLTDTDRRSIRGCPGPEKRVLGTLGEYHCLTGCGSEPRKFIFSQDGIK